MLIDQLQEGCTATYSLADDDFVMRVQPTMDEPAARDWLRTLVMTYGERAAVEAYQVTNTAMRDEKPIKEPLKFLSKVAPARG